MQRSDSQYHFLVALLAGAFLLVCAVFWPFLKPLALAAVFAVVLQQVYTGVFKVLGGWPSLSALITVLMGVFFILLPLSLVGSLVGTEARTLYLSLETEQRQGAVTDTLLGVGESYDRFIPGIKDFTITVSTDINTYLKEALRWIAGHAGDIFSSISRFLLSSFIFLIALYYFLRDGARARKMLIEISPLPDDENIAILAQLERAVSSIIKGSLVIALVQGVLTMVGFSFFGIPGAILWGAVAAVAALIPGIGTSLVIAPAVVYLFIIGATPQAFGLLIWGILAVGLIDNLLGPKLVGKGMKLHPLLVLLSVLGGLAFFGTIGIFLGPLSLSLLFALLSIYAGSDQGSHTAE